MSFCALFVILQLTLVYGALPDGWKTCSKGKSDQNECLRVAINDAIHSLVSGNRKLGVLPVDPLHFGRIVTKGDPKGPVALEIVFDDFVLRNLKNLEITNVELNGRNLKMKGKVPGTLDASSPYSVRGRILTLPITGKGPSNFSFHDGDISFDLTFKEKPAERKGKKYLVVERFVEVSKPKKLDIYLGNLFNGNKALGDTMNNVLNENWELVWTELQPLFEQALSEAYLQMSNKVFSNIPMNELHLL